MDAVPSAMALPAAKAAGPAAPAGPTGVVFDIKRGSAEDGRPAPRDGRYHIDMLPTTCHVHVGSVTGATPDGRHHGAPLSEGISPVQGADRRGPAAVLRAAQARPEEHRGLLVRVAGYGDVFCGLGRELQDEIIARTEHAGA